MTIIDGKKIANKLLEDLKLKVQNYEKKAGLAVILANDNPASKVYVSTKEKRAKELGFNSFVYKFDKKVTQDEIINLIKKLNNDPKIDGILVQLPLFEHLNEAELIETIAPNKDVDGFHPINVGKLNIGLKPYAVPCTPKGIIKLLKEYDINIEGKHAVVIGRSNIVGKPIAALLLKENATVTQAHSKTANLAKITKSADIIISATGKANLVTSDMVKKGAVVVDVGIIKQEDNSLVGDVDFNSTKDIAGFITPVPGGVGPMTIACLMENTFELFLEHNDAKL